MNPAENNSAASSYTTHFSDSDFTKSANKKNDQSGIRAYVPPLILPNGRPSFARTVSRLELSSRSGSPHSPISKSKPSPAHSPLRPDFEKLSFAESTSQRKKIDKGCKKYFKVQFKQRNPTVISSALLASKVDIVARYEIEKRFLKSKSCPITNKQLILYIQNSGILISNIQRRLQILLEILEGYASLHGAKTERLCDLRKSLLHLISLNEDLVEFSMALEKLQIPGSKTGKLLWEIISMAIEDKQGKTATILSTLDKWANPTDFEIDLLEKHIEEVTLIQSIPGTEVAWVESDDAAYPIDSITTEDTIRSMFPSENVLMNTITINDAIFYQNSRSTKTYNQQTFFKELLSALYQAGYASKRERDVGRDLDTLFTAAQFSSEKLPAYLKKHPLPVLDLLRPYTISSWGHADQLIRKSFPRIFETPYCAKIKQGVDCSFSITDSKEHSVSVLKTYQIYFRQDTLNMATFPIPDPERLICELTFEWTLSKKDSIWTGNLAIKEASWNTATPWEDQKVIAQGIVPKVKELSVSIAASSSEGDSEEEKPSIGRAPTPHRNGGGDKIACKHK